MGGIQRPKTDEKLESETRKWLSKLEGAMKEARQVKGAIEAKVLKNSMDNVHAYISDCKYFLAEKDFVNAFEAIIYAWGIFETLERMGFMERKGNKC